MGMFLITSNGDDTVVAKERSDFEYYVSTIFQKFSGAEDKIPVKTHEKGAEETKVGEYFYKFVDSKPEISFGWKRTFSLCRVDEKECGWVYSNKVRKVRILKVITVDYVDVAPSVIVVPEITLYQMFLAHQEEHRQWAGDIYASNLEIKWSLNYLTAKMNL